MRYEAHRHILTEASEAISLPEILGTKEGITALATFLEKSGAFTKTGHRPKKQPLPNFEEEPIPELELEPDDADGGELEQEGNAN
jgi:hypothetical protein